MVVLRDYQIENLEETYYRNEAGNNRLLNVIGTGGGKTVIFAQYPKLFKTRGLIVAHREELLKQAARKVLAANPKLTVGIEQAHRQAPSNADVVVASVQSVGTERGIKRLQRHFDFGWLVFDEAHHSVARTYRNIAEHYGFACTLEDRFSPRDMLLSGFTATPKRTDKIGLDYVFDEVTRPYSSRYLIEQGYLVDFNYRRVYSNESLDDVTVRHGEFAEEELADAVNTLRRNELIVSSYLQYAKGLRTIVFCVNVEHVHDVTNLFCLAGVRAESIIGASLPKYRAGVLSRFKSGETQVLVNCQVATEGFDEPGIGCVIQARPTKSSLVYIQILGRGSRAICSLAHPDARSRYIIGDAKFWKDETDKNFRLKQIRSSDKPNCLVIDIVDNCKKHTPVMLASLYGLNKDIDIDGRNIVETVQALEGVQEEFHGKIKMEDIVDVDRILAMRTSSDKIDIWDIPTEVSEEVCKHSKFAWIKLGDKYRLDVNSHIAIELEQDTLGHWYAYEIHNAELDPSGKPFRQYPQERDCLNDGNPESDIYSMFAHADAYVMRYFEFAIGVLRHDVAWRSNPASPEQVAWLVGRHFPIEERETARGRKQHFIHVAGMIKELTAGMANYLITKKIAEYKQRRERKKFSK